MKKSLLCLSVIASTMTIAGGEIVPVEPAVEATPSNTGSFAEALKNGKYSANMRVFYFDRSYDDDGQTPNSSTFTFGGIMKYESGDYRGFKFGLAYYGNHKLGDVFDRIDAKGASMLDDDGSYDDLAFLGEAYLQYDIANTMFKVGRQQLATPLIENHDLRMLPSVYEAAIVRNTDITDTMLEAGYIKRYTGFGSRDNGFEDYNAKWGENGLAYLYVTNKSIENLTLAGQYVKAISDTDAAGNRITVKDYSYADATYALAFGTNTYIKGQYGGNTYANADDSMLLGAKIGTTLSGMVDVAVLYDKILDNSFKAVEAGPMYSDWQQGYGPYDPSTAFGGQLIVKPIDKLSVKLACVKVDADKNFREDGTYTDDFTEFNLDAQYTLNDYSAVRVRYSVKDQTDTSDRADRDDLRVIYYLNF